MKFYIAAAVSSFLLAPLDTFAAVPPCNQIANVCKSSGFVVYANKSSALKSGQDLWQDCYCPIIQGTAQPANAKKALPAGDFSALVEQCRTQQPAFGHCD